MLATPDIKTNCYHCGDECPDDSIKSAEYLFCCQGCKTVYELLSENGLDNYYSIENTPGISQKSPKEKRFSFLKNQSIKEKILEFTDGTTAVVSLHLPAIHCSSCIWLLENLSRLHKGVISVQVHFPKKTARITYKEEVLSLDELAELLYAIGYEPNINLADTDSSKQKGAKKLIYQLGVAGFAFGNIMLLALPEYLSIDEESIEAFSPFMRYISMALALPVLFYSASGYFTSAIKGLKQRFVNIDVPIALGIIVLFIRSSYEVLSHTGQGYFDSLAALVFFLLLGKYFQQKTYDALSFEHDYKSYFPVAVTRIANDTEESIELTNLKKGDRILIRNGELLPVDSILIKGEGYIDNSFVTGESDPVRKLSGDKIYAGGKQMGEAIELEVLKPVEKSYLVQLWNHQVFKTEKQTQNKSLTDSISKYFTLAILLIATISFVFWAITDVSMAIKAFTAVLIVACPCALALSAPFTWGNTLRILGKNKFYAKSAEALEALSKVQHIVFDKTGTITENQHNKLVFKGDKLSLIEEQYIKSVLRQSNHPLSRTLYEFLGNLKTLSTTNFTEETSLGIQANVEGKTIKIGSAKWVGSTDENTVNRTQVYIVINDKIKGFFEFSNSYRKGIKSLFSNLQESYTTSVISGDNDGEKTNLEDLMGKNSSLLFNQKPEDKLRYIENLQSDGEKIMMVGDGLNDAGALKQSNFGLSVSENTNTFSPACDAIIDASVFSKLNLFLKLVKKSTTIIKISFVLSFLYNIVGLFFAVTGQLSPVMAAILMPISSITIVVFVTLATSYTSHKIKLL